MRQQITHYFDYKSPYAYLAQEETFRLEADYDVRVDFVPYTLDIPSFLGSAEVDADGQVLGATRSAHQWRRVRYSYMDCRREANRRGLVLRGPRRIFDSSLAHIAMLYAKARGDFRRYHDIVFERFWRRELDIEDAHLIMAALREGGVDPHAFPDYLQGEGRREHDRLRAAAEELGVFGVPSYLVEGELFWGAERLPRLRERLHMRP